MQPLDAVRYAKLLEDVEQIAPLPAAVLLKVAPKGVNVERSEIARRRAENKRNRPRPNRVARAKAKRISRKKRARARG